MNITNIKNVLKHPLIYGSSILVFGNLISNFLNFLFNLFMSRTLLPANYGTLATITAFIGFPVLAANAIIPLVIRYAGEYFAKGQLHMARGLYIKVTQILIVIAVVMCLLFLLFIGQIGAFLQIRNTFILYLTDAIIFVTFISVINGAFMQAKLSFVFQVIVSIVNSGVKVFFGVLLVLLGFSINGTVFAMIMASLAGYLVSFIPLRFIFSKQVGSPSFNTKELFSYGIPSALTLFGLTSFISADIILVKHFFSPTLAGYYAGLSLIGRVIFYLSSPIASVMFPLIVQKHAKKENFTNTFKLSLGIVLLPSLLLTLFYFLFPHFTILFFLKKTDYLGISSLLGLFGIFITLYCVLTLICNFYLSIKKLYIFIPVILGAFAQILLISFYHQTFMQIILISLIITFLLVSGLLLYYPYATKK